MAKNKVANENTLEVPIDLTETDVPVAISEVNKIAIRRGKVRELFRMGYEPHQIFLVLQKGIKIGDERIQVPISEFIIKADIEYIRQEDAAVDVDFPEKRAEVVDKLRFLYQQAIKEYINAKGSVKNSFLNTALTILNRISEIEGIDNASPTDNNINEEVKLAKFIAEAQGLKEGDKDVLVAAIRQILEKHEQEPTGVDGVPIESSGIPTQASNDEGVSRES